MVSTVDLTKQEREMKNHIQLSLILALAAAAAGCDQEDRTTLPVPSAPTGLGLQENREPLAKTYFERVYGYDHIQWDESRSSRNNKRFTDCYFMRKPLHDDSRRINHALDDGFLYVGCITINPQDKTVITAVEPQSLGMRFDSLQPGHGN